MKRFLKITIVLLLVLTAKSNYAQLKSDSTKKMDPSKEYVTIDHGKTVEYRNNEWGYLMDEFTCTNGDKVSVDGTITKANGGSVKLSEGDKIFGDGHMIKESENKSTSRSSKTGSKSKTAYPPK